MRFELGWPYEVRVALRYLRSSGLQSVMILLGVAVGIVAYTFMAALINGLAVRLTRDVVGNLPHVTLEPPRRPPALVAGIDPGRALVAVQETEERREQITDWQSVTATTAELGEVMAISPQAEGNGFFQRGAKVQAVTMVGVEPARISAIIDVEGGIVRGSAHVGPGDVAIGVVLAEELAVTTGQPLRLRSERGRERTLTVRGIFDVGSANANERLAFLDLRTAQTLLELEGTVTRIELKIRDIDRAREVSSRLAAATGLEAKNWIDQNPRFQDALKSQATTGQLIKIFSLATIVIAITSVLLISVVRRQAEIGILRSFGATRRSVRLIFQLQGFFLGLFGSSLGALGGWSFCLLLVAALRRPDGTPVLPLAPADGEYLTAIVLATVAGTVAAILPAHRAAKVDPVEVIQH